MTENNFKHKFQLTFNIKGKLVVFNQPIVMGILNLTSDSFYEKSRVADLNELMRKAEEMLNDGAHILDLGAQSTRPGAEIISADDELKRIIPALSLLHKEFPEALISVDTFYAKVAKESVHAGASIINDVSAGEDDKNMLQTVAKLSVPYIFMHKKGTPKTMQQNPKYENVVQEVIQYLLSKIEHLKILGIHDFIADPGFGFGKTLKHNYELFNQLSCINEILPCPILVGISRKSMIWKTLDISADESLIPTSALHLVALQKGVSILRVHDVKPALQMIKLMEYIY